MPITQAENLAIRHLAPQPADDARSASGSIAAPHAQLSSVFAAQTDGPAMPLIRAGGDPGYSSTPANMLAVGDDVFYTAQDATSGRELWRSDGTAQGTRLLADLAPGQGSGMTTPLAVLGQHMFFRWSYAEYGPDNTARFEYGIFRANRDGSNIVRLRDVIATAPLVLGDKLYFHGYNGAGADGLFRSDGTAEGTVLIAPMPGDASNPTPAILGNRFLFNGGDPHGVEPWVSDGTPQGTTLLKDIFPGANTSYPLELTSAGDRVFFSANDGVHGRELWVSDGTPGGTRMVRDIVPGAEDTGPVTLVAAGNLVYFVLGNVPDSPGIQLWRSDGTANGTIQLATFPGVSANWRPWLELLPIGNRLLIKIRQSDGVVQLWRSEGSLASTRLVADLGVGITWGAAELNGQLFFLGGFDSILSLWRSDGTGQGTQPVTTIQSGWNLTHQSYDLIRAGTRLFLIADDEAHGVELWASDGTAQGTRMVKDVEGPNPASYPRILGMAGGKLLFSFYQLETGFELWQSDGTTAGSLLLKDIRPGSASSSPELIGSFGGKLMFSADDGVHGRELWVSDGTVAGTQLLADLTLGRGETYLKGTAVALDGRLFFTTIGDRINMLWVSDGTARGTLALTTVALPFQINQLYVAGGKVFFSQIHITTNQAALWVSDGTVSGTREIGAGNVYEASDGSGGTAFLGVSADTNGTELWVSDGTTQGTRLLKDIRPGQAGSVPMQLTYAGNRLFFSADDATNGRELWVSDGTEAGTQLLKDVRPGVESGLEINVPPCGGETGRITRLGDKVYFPADDGLHGTELWVSDGTAPGTQLVHDIAQPALEQPETVLRNSYPARLTVVSDTLVFIATDWQHGFELWVSDGSAAGTSLIQDLKPGPANGLSRINSTLRPPCSYTIFNDILAAYGNLYFVGDDMQGRGLWKIAGASDPYLALDASGVRPGDIGVLPIRYGNHGLTPTTATLTVTLDAGLTYLSDTSGLTPTIVSNTISWQLPWAGAGARGFSLQFTVAPSATLGTHYGVSALMQTESDADPTNNSADSTILVARQTFFAIMQR